MRILIAIITCAAMKKRADACRATWVPDVPRAREVDVKFFMGGVVSSENGDTVTLPCADDYEGLPDKTLALVRWALDRGYDYLFKCDDDTYVQPGRLLSSGFQEHDYSGRLRGPSGEYPAPYCSGFSYFLSKRAMVALLESPSSKDTAEDRMVGNAMLRAGIAPHPDYRYVVVRAHRNAASGKEGPRVGNDVISAGEVEPWEMPNVHALWQKTPSKLLSAQAPGVRPYSDVAVMVKTFLRDGYLKKCVTGIEKSLPGAQVIVVDDGRETRDKITWYSELRARGHKTLWLPLDSGFCAKSNAAVEALDRPYLLIGSDDFDFEPPYVREGVDRMLSVLRHDPEIACASGRVNFRDYQGFCSREGSMTDELGRSVTGTVLRETRLDRAADPKRTTPDGVDYWPCDLTVNYNLVRREVFHPPEQPERNLADCGPLGVRWDPAYKIGGDHYEFYAQLADRRLGVAFVDGVDIRELPRNDRLQSPEYAKYRGRAVQALPRFFAKAGLTRYVMFDGSEDVLQEDGSVRHIPPPADARPAASMRVSPGEPRVSGHPAEDAYVASESLFHSDREGVIVGESHPRRRGLLVRKGSVIPMEAARRLGLA